MNYNVLLANDFIYQAVESEVVESEVVECPYSQLLSFFLIRTRFISSPVFYPDSTSPEAGWLASPVFASLHGISAIARQAMKDACD